MSSEIPRFDLPVKFPPVWASVGLCEFTTKLFLFSGRLKALRSGPSSMIELEQFEENDDMSMLLNTKHTCKLYDL